jgi:hypothetical protein
MQLEYIIIKKLRSSFDLEIKTSIFILVRYIELFMKKINISESTKSRFQQLAGLNPSKIRLDEFRGSTHNLPKTGGGSKPPQDRQPTGGDENDYNAGDLFYDDTQFQYAQGYIDLKNGKPYWFLDMEGGINDPEEFEGEGWDTEYEMPYPSIASAISAGLKLGVIEHKKVWTILISKETEAELDKIHEWLGTEELY